jgi:hypothetical protein
MLVVISCVGSPGLSTIPLGSSITRSTSLGHHNIAEGFRFAGMFKHDYQ